MVKKNSFVVTRSLSAVSVLNQVRDDLLKLEWEKISDVVKIEKALDDWLHGFICGAITGVALAMIVVSVFW